MDAMLGLLSLIGMLVCFILTIISLIRRRKVRVYLIAFCGCVVLLITALSMPSVESTNNVPETTDSLSVTTPTYIETDESKIAIAEAVKGNSAFSPTVTVEKTENNLYNVIAVFSENESRYADVRWCGIDLASVLDGMVEYRPEELKKVNNFSAEFVSPDNTYISIVQVNAYTESQTFTFSDEAHNNYTVTQKDRNRAKRVLTIDEFVQIINTDRESAKREFDDKSITLTGRVKQVVDGGIMTGYYLYGKRGDSGLRIVCWVDGEQYEPNMVGKMYEFSGILREISYANATEVGECRIYEVD